MKSPRVNFRLPQKTLAEVDHLVKIGRFKDRTEFFNTATTQLLNRETLKSLEKIQEGKHYP